MSSLNVDTIKNRTGTAGPTIAGDTQISGGGLTLSGTIIAQAGIVTNLQVNGRLSVAGTMTTIDTEELNIKDKLVGIGSTATPTDALADGAGIQVFGTTDKKLTYNNTKKGFEFNVPLSTDENRIVTASEKVVQASGNTVGLQYNSGGNIAVVTGSSGDITLNVESIPETPDFDNNAISFSLAIVQAGTARSCTTVNLNGYTAPIRWAGGSLASATSGLTTTSGMDVYSFTGINTVGSASTCTNYYLLGAVNGGYA